MQSGSPLVSEKRLFTMPILKNHYLVLLIALMMLPAVYLLRALSSDVSKLLFVAAMLIIVWAANEAAD